MKKRRAVPFVFQEGELDHFPTLATMKLDGLSAWFQMQGLSDLEEARVVLSAEPTEPGVILGLLVEHVNKDACDYFLFQNADTIHIAVSGGILCAAGDLAH